MNVYEIHASYQQRMEAILGNVRHGYEHTLKIVHDKLHQAQLKLQQQAAEVSKQIDAAILLERQRGQGEILAVVAFERNEANKRTEAALFQERQRGQRELHEVVAEAIAICDQDAKRHVLHITAVSKQTTEQRVATLQNELNRRIADINAFHRQQSTSEISKIHKQSKAEIAHMHKQFSDVYRQRVLEVQAMQTESLKKLKQANATISALKTALALADQQPLIYTGADLLMKIHKGSK